MLYLGHDLGAPCRSSTEVAGHFKSMCMALPYTTAPPQQEVMTDDSWWSPGKKQKGVTTPGNARRPTFNSNRPTIEWACYDEARKAHLAIVAGLVVTPLDDCLDKATVPHQQVSHLSA
eukprot:1159668-Pelagomonas_calceolata.AAC.4